MFSGTPRKFYGMCGVVGIKDSPIIITYYFLFVNKRRNEKDNDGGDGDIVLYWLGPVAPNLLIPYSLSTILLSICQRA